MLELGTAVWIFSRVTPCASVGAATRAPPAAPRAAALARRARRRVGLFKVFMSSVSFV